MIYFVGMEIHVPLVIRQYSGISHGKFISQLFVDHCLFDGQDGRKNSIGWR